MSIFSEENKVKTNWFNFKTVGDKIEGTYVGKRSMISKMSGNEQTIFEIKVENGEIVFVGGKKMIDDQMKHIKLGQIVGFEYVGDKKLPGRPQPMKVIQVYANPTLVDKEWIDSQEELLPTNDDEITSEQIFGKEDVKNEPKEIKENKNLTVEDIDKMSDTEKLAIIGDLIATKFNVNDIDRIKITAMEKTSLAFIATNYGEIAKKLLTM